MLQYIYLDIFIPELFTEINYIHTPKIVICIQGIRFYLKEMKRKNFKSFN